MDNEKRGMAIIFNHEHFDPRAEKRLKPRNGTQVDCNRLKDCLENLGFTVTVYQDLIFLDIYRELEKRKLSDCIKNKLNQQHFSFAKESF